MRKDRCGGLVIKLCLTLATPWTIACQVPLSMGFSRQEYWNELPFPSLVDHILSELFTMTCQFWVPLHCMAYSFMSYASPFTTTRL